MANLPIPSSAGTAPAGQVPTHGAAAIFTGYAPAPKTSTTPTSTPVVPPTPTPPVTPATTPTNGQGTQTSPTAGYIAPPTTTPTGPQQTSVGGGQNNNPGSLGNYNTTGTTGTATANPAPYGSDPNGVPYGGPNSNNPNPNTSNGSTYTGPLSEDPAKYTAEANALGERIYQLGMGTMPLSAAEQAQIDGLKSQFDAQISAQQSVNTNNEGTAQIQGYQTGTAEYNRTYQLSVIGQIVSAGQTKITQIQTAEASAVAQLTASLQSNDLSGAKSAYDAYSSIHADVAKSIQDTIASTQQAMKDASIANVISSGTTNPADILKALQKNGNTNITADDITKAIANLSPDAKNILQIETTAAQNGASPAVLSAIGSAKTVTDALTAAGNSLSMTDINGVLKTAASNNAPQSILDAIKNSANLSDAIAAAGKYVSTLTGDMGQYLQYTQDATKAGQVPESYTTWENAQEYNKAYSTAAGTAAGKNAGTPSGFSGATSPVTSPLGLVYNPPASIAPYVAFASNGVKYVDMSAFKGTPTEANAAVADAQAAGYKVITNKNIALDIQNIADATAKLQTIKTAFDGITTDSVSARDSYYSAAITMAKELQTNPDAAASGVFQDAALDVLKAISGTQGFRGGASMVQAVQSTFPSNTDTQQVADQKIANIQKLMTDRETALVGVPSATDKLLIDGTKATSALDTYSSNNPAVVDKLNKLTALNMSDSDIITYIQDPSHGFPNYGDLVNWNQ